MVTLPVSPAKARALHERMEGLEIREADLRESFVRSSGKGGQNVNKVATCVVLRHELSGYEVKCQRARTQGLNRYYARVQLCDLVENERLGRQSREQQRREKIRRQKRRRSKRAQEKILQQKRERSEIKTQRKRPSVED